MRFSPDADARSMQYKTASHSTHLRQTLLLLALFIAGVVISVIVVRHVDPPRAHIVNAPEKTGAAQTPDLPAGKPAGVVPA
jgi:hypothetical protein